jgi:hypothetical protein
MVCGQNEDFAMVQTLRCAASANKPLVYLDGLNLMRLRPDRASLETPLIVMMDFLRLGWDVCAIFDASARHLLREMRGNDCATAFEYLLTHYSRHFIQTACKTAADDVILPEVYLRSAWVCSNDTYQNHIKRFPWIKDFERYVRVNRVRDHLHVQNRTLPIRADFDCLIPQLIDLLSEIR